MSDFEAIIMDRFGDRISPEPNSGCWLWTGAAQGRRNAALYAKARYDGEIVTMNTVIRKLKGLTGQDMRHRCGVSLCVNPAHLTDGTRSQNMMDMSPEVRSEKSRKSNLLMTPEERSERGKKAAAARYAAMTPGQRSESIRKAWITRRAGRQ
jgi:hypothetical protein